MITLLTHAELSQTVDNDNVHKDQKHVHGSKMVGFG